MVVRCTKKMLDLLGGRTLTLSDLPPSDEDWYLNLVWIERQKCLLLTHSGTLFSVFRASVHMADLRPLGVYLVEAIQTELRTEGLPQNTFPDLDPDDLRLAKTASRSTLGFMTEMAFELGWIIHDKRGLRRSDINYLNHALRRMFWNRGDYVRPIELVHQRLNAQLCPSACGRLAPLHLAAEYLNPTRSSCSRGVPSTAARVGVPLPDRPVRGRAQIAQPFEPVEDEVESELELRGRVVQCQQAASASREEREMEVPVTSTTTEQPAAMGSPAGQQMRAIVQKEYGTADVLRVAEIERVGCKNSAG